MTGAWADDGGIVADAEQELGVGRLFSSQVVADEVEFAEGFGGGVWLMGRLPETIACIMFSLR